MFSALLTAIGSSLLFLLLHIQNGSGFPKPLTAKEEREQLEKRRTVTSTLGQF